MQLTNSFNPMEHDPNAAGGGGLPVGKHPVVIKSAELKATKDNTGGLVEFTLEAIDGPARGTEMAYRLNLYNSSEKAVRLAHSQLAALCHVTQQFQLGADGRQLSVLFNIPFVVEVGLQKGEEAQEKGYTEVKKVYDMQGNPPGKQGQQTQQASSGFTQQPAQQQAAGWGGGLQQQTGPAQGQSAPAGAWGAGGAQQGQQAASQPAQGGWGGQGTQQAGNGGAPAQGGGWQQGQGGGQAAGWGGPQQ